MPKKGPPKKKQRKADSSGVPCCGVPPWALSLWVAAAAVLLWPWLGRGLARRRPGLHTLLGVFCMLLAGALTVLEVLR